MCARRRHARIREARILVRGNKCWWAFLETRVGDPHITVHHLVTRPCHVAISLGDILRFGFGRRLRRRSRCLLPRLTPEGGAGRKRDCEDFEADNAM